MYGTTADVYRVLRQADRLQDMLDEQASKLLESRPPVELERQPTPGRISLRKERGPL